MKKTIYSLSAILVFMFTGCMSSDDAPIIAAPLEDNVLSRLRKCKIKHCNKHREQKLYGTFYFKKNRR